MRVCMCEQLSKLRIRLFGIFEVWREGQLLDNKAWPRRKTAMLLKWLLTQRGHTFTQDQLIEALYPESDPDRVARNLAGRISELRHLLEPNLKKGQDSSYILRVAPGAYCFSDRTPCWIDTEVFQRHIKTALQQEKAGRWHRAIQRYEIAVGLYRGDYLTTDLYEEWTLELREHWCSLYVNTLLDLAKCYAHLQQFARASVLLEQALAIRPNEERLYRHQMRCHYWAGQQDLALKTYHAYVQHLDAELDVEPDSKTQALYDQIVHHQLPPPPPIAVYEVPTPLTHFFGREDELDRIHTALEDPNTRLFTITGPGGAGKTRLGVEVVAPLRDVFPDGIQFIPCSSIHTTASLTAQIVAALRIDLAGTTSLESLFDRLENKKMLWVLDGCEQFDDEVATWLVQVLRRVPGLKCLLTSQRRLGLQTESVLKLQGLPYPNDLPSKNVLSAYPAIQLFLDRAHKHDSRQSAFQNEDILAQICHEVQGMPLALELAAMWVSQLSLEEIVNTLKRHPEELSLTFHDIPERQRSLAAVFDYSWALLTDGEQTLMRQLSVFQGGFDAAAAQAISGASLAELSKLVDKSWLQSVPGRYDMHGLLQQFVRGVSQEGFQSTSVKDRHCDYFTSWLCRSARRFRTLKESSAFAALHQELSNLRLAWLWAAQRRRHASLCKMMDPLFYFLKQEQYTQEGVKFFEQGLAYFSLDAAHQNAQALYGKLLVRQGALLAQESPQQAHQLLQYGLSIARIQTDPEEQAFALYYSGTLAYISGDCTVAHQQLQQSLNLYQTSKAHSANVADVLNGLANVYILQKNYSQAKALYQQSLYCYQKIGDLRKIATVLNNLGGLALCNDHPGTATRLYQESLDIRKKINDRQGILATSQNLNSASAMATNPARTERGF